MSLTPGMPSSPELVGRQAIVDRVGEWAHALGTGPSGLLITGEPGIGKTMLWQAALDRAQLAGARVLVARPVEAELPLGYAGLADLLGAEAQPLLERLPPMQAEALAGALGIGASSSGDARLVARTTLTSLALLAEPQPVVVAIDDVQWLDAPSARALAFAARRLGGVRCSFAVTLRDGTSDPIAAAEAFAERLTHVRLEGLSFGAMAHLIRQRCDPDIPRRLLTRIHERSRGNPFHAMQLARAGEDGLSATIPEGLVRHLAQVSGAAHEAIEEIAVLGPRPLTAFPDPAGIDDAVRAGILVEDPPSIRFAHPLLANAAYRQIPPGRRRALHAAAAGRAELPVDRARHLALATVGHDDVVAALLQDVARAERARGAPESAAELAEHARRLTSPNDLEALASRAMDRAEYLFLAADEASAVALVDEILAGPVRGSIRVRALLQKALGEIDAPAAVARLEAAVAEPHTDTALGARALSQLAWQRGAWLGDVQPAIPEATRAVELAERVGDEGTLVASLATLGLLLSIAGDARAEATFRRAVDVLGRAPNAAGDHTPHIAFAHERWWRGDFDTAAALLVAERRRALDHGDEGMLMRIAIFGAELEIRRGRWTEADRLLDEALLAAQGYWRLTALIRRGILRARRGDRATLEDAAELRASPPAEGDPVFPAAAAFIEGLTRLADGEATVAADLLARLPEQTATHPSRGAEFGVLIPEAVAALAAAGQVERALGLITALESRAAHFGAWGQAASGYCRGVLALAAADIPAARDELAAAARGFEEIGAPWELGQTLLAEGMTLRRAGRRLEAGRALDRALAIFTGLGAGPAGRAAADELRRARPRRTHDDGLTPAEARVAELVAAGQTNREVAARLFTTVATVEAHLTRIYGKLGVRSRTELARRISDGSLHLDPRPDSTRRPGRGSTSP